MRKALARGIVITLNVALLPGIVTAQEIPEALRQNMPYSEARELLLHEGWLTRYRDLSQKDKLTGLLGRMVNELGYPEFQDCSGTGAGFCRAWFGDGYGQRLTLITVNNQEEPILFRWWVEEEPEEEPE
ncbi:hypothetical protein NG796_24550 [Laspinema sp. A4]|uniref:hypothetical protein n=1 Tax=Laspinema sp. D2d TaxID=2953686 RepID=UPI0021BA5312|nr:hypothetical protein [Laspinema sp. D2d]MCT7986446.1 hypothetical protein [Laspinema sp. D2d]